MVKVLVHKPILACATATGRVIIVLLQSALVSSQMQLSFAVAMVNATPQTSACVMMDGLELIVTHQDATMFLQIQPMFVVVRVHVLM